MIGGVIMTATVKRHTAGFYEVCDNQGNMTGITVVSCSDYRPNSRGWYISVAGEQWEWARTLVEAKIVALRIYWADNDLRADLIDS